MRLTAALRAVGACRPANSNGLSVRDAIVDAADYYHVAREAMLAARQRILVIGWDFDTRIPLEPEEKRGGDSLGRFFLELARRTPRLQIDILKWSFGAKKHGLVTA